MGNNIPPSSDVSANISSPITPINYSNKERKYIKPLLVAVLIVGIIIITGIFYLERSSQNSLTAFSTTNNASKQTSSFGSLANPTTELKPTLKDASQEKINIPTGQLNIDEKCHPVALYKSKLVCFSVQQKILILKDIVTNEEQSIDTIGDAEIYGINISGEYIVWADNHEKNIAFKEIKDVYSYDIYVYNYKSKIKKKLSLQPALRLKLDFDGQYIAWTERTKQYTLNNEIYIYDLSSDQIVYSSTFASNKSYFSLNDKKLVWTDSRDYPDNNQGGIFDRNYNIYLYDLLLKQETIPVKYPASKFVPKIFGNYITWVDRRNNKDAIYLRDLRDGQDKVIYDGGITPVDLDINFVGDKLWFIIRESCDVKQMKIVGSSAGSFQVDPIIYSDGLFVYNINNGKLEKKVDGKEIFVIPDRENLLIRDVCPIKPYEIVKI